MTVRYLQEQADRAERLAKGVLDALACEALMKYARECRDPANVTAPFATDQDTIDDYVEKSTGDRRALHAPNHSIG